MVRRVYKLSYTTARLFLKLATISRDEFAELASLSRKSARSQPKMVPSSSIGVITLASTFLQLARLYPRIAVTR
jgi:hypothetical protein